MRPARSADVEAARETFPDLLPDRWREGDDRRSLVAVDGEGRVIGHCRGIDNELHPGSRVMLLEVAPEHEADGTGDALLAAQREISHAALHVKLTARQEMLIALLERAGGVAIQAMPPWRYVVGPAMRAWAEAHRQRGGSGPDPLPIGPADRSAVLDLEAAHYVAQHAGWSPSAPLDVMRAELAAGHEEGAECAYDPVRSRVLHRGGRVVAAALLWPEDDGGGWTADTEVTAGGREVSLIADLADPRANEDKALCLAGLVAACADGDQLLIDSHLSLAAEQELLRDLPGRVENPEDWGAIVAVPVAGAPAPIPLPAALVPEEAAWIRGLCRA